MTELLLETRALSIFDPNCQKMILTQINLKLRWHRTLAILGASGSGKSLLAKTLIGLCPPPLAAKGAIFFRDSWLRKPDWQPVRGSAISLLQQHATTAFNPIRTLGNQFAETLRQHFPHTHRVQQQEANALLQALGLHDCRRILNSYPHQLSGGQLQRSMIALSIALNPNLVIADECTAALDPQSQYAVMALFKQRLAAKQLSLIFISHDLGLVADIADDIAVIHNGTIVEYRSKKQLFADPCHPYTQLLLATRQRLYSPFTQLMASNYAGNS